MPKYFIEYVNSRTETHYVKLGHYFQSLVTHKASYGKNIEIDFNKEKYASLKAPYA